MQHIRRGDEVLVSLTDLELRVARRADELARAGYSPTQLKLGCWLQAEQELLDPVLLERAASLFASPSGSPPSAAAAPSETGSPPPSA